MATAPCAPGSDLRRHAWRMCGITMIVLAAVALAAVVGLPAALDAWLRADIYGIAGTAPSSGWPGDVARVVVVLLSGLVCMPLLLRADGIHVFTYAASFIALAVAVDALLLSVAGVAWGAGGVILVLGGGAIASSLCERTRALRGVRRLEDWLHERIRGMASHDAEFERDALYRDHFAELCQAYLDFARSSVVAELPPGRWHLDFRGFWNMSEADVDEPRRDIRRMPYQEPLATGKFLWVQDFIAPEFETRSLLVPLMGAQRPVGLWVVNLPADLEWSEAHQQVIDRLAEYLTLTLAPAPAALPAQPQPLWERLLAPDRALPEVASIARLSQVVATGQRWLLGLLDDAPVGMLAAGLWGDVVYANGAMRRMLSEGGVKEPRNLAQVLMALTGQPHEAVLLQMRRVVTDGAAWRFRQQRKGNVSQAYELVRWVPSNDNDPGEAVPWRLVLTALPEVAKVTETGVNRRMGGLRA